MTGSHDRSNRLIFPGSPYALAIGATLLAFGATYALRRATLAPVFLFFVAAIAISAWYGGRAPSILATVLSLVFTKLAFKPPVGSLWIRDLQDVIPFAVFLTVAVVIIGTIEALRSARALAESHAAELERVNEELRHALISRRLLAAQETERRRIARVLHEDVGQLLTAVRMNLQRLTSPYRGDGDAVVGDSIGLVDETLEHVRDLSLELRPSVLDELGLGEALTWYARRQAERAGYEVAVEQALGEDRLPESIETAAFRIVQQALTNIARHAEARRVQIALRRMDRAVELEVVDDGIGFDVAEARARSLAGESLGLVHMIELAHLVGGSLDITSKEGKGAVIRVRFPVDPVT